MKYVPCVALVLAASTVAAHADEELYRQNPVANVGGISSQDARNPGGLGWFSEVSDNFTVSGPVTITQVQFWGGYVQPEPGNTEGFMIRFYTDAGNQVGDLISTQDVMTFTEVPDFTNTLGARFHTTCDLNEPVTLPAAGQYWLSVVAILPRGGSSIEPQWGWVNATTLTPPPVRQVFFGSVVPTSNDVAFVLVGSSGPSCATSDFDGDGDAGTDQDIEAFFSCLAGICCPTCWHLGADFDADGDAGTDADIEAFFRVLAGGEC
jgi:hypothetical protein